MMTMNAKNEPGNENVWWMLIKNDDWEDERSERYEMVLKKENWEKEIEQNYL